MKKYLLFLIVFISSCSRDINVNDIPLPKITTPTEMYPTLTQTIPPGPYYQSEPLNYLSMLISFSFFDEGIPVINNGYLEYYPLPSKSEALWDYDWKTDTLAYAENYKNDTSCKEALTGDLWIYDYHTNTKIKIMDRVSSAKWSPVIYPETNEHLLAVNICKKQLAIISIENPKEITIINENSDPHFLWSPDGLWIAFVTETNLIIIPSKGGPERIIRNDINRIEGSMFDKFIWVNGHNALILNGTPFSILDINKKESFIPINQQGNSPAEYWGVQFLWDDNSHTLVSFGEEIKSRKLIIYMYTLSEDLRNILETHVIDSKYVMESRIIVETLVGWWIPGESIITLGKKIWSVKADNDLIMDLPKK